MMITPRKDQCKQEANAADSHAAIEAVLEPLNECYRYMVKYGEHEAAKIYKELIKRATELQAQIATTESTAIVIKCCEILLCAEGLYKAILDKNHGKTAGRHGVEG